MKKTINLLIINYKSACKRLDELRNMRFCLLISNKFIQNKLSLKTENVYFVLNVDNS